MVDRIVLIGMMGAGKTTVGRLLAERLGWHHLDSDDQVEVETGHTVPELFELRGEAAFRAEEARVLAEALSGERPVVVSAAGGVVLDAANRSLIARSGTVVWLRADPRLLARRVGSGAGRPLLEGDPAARIVALDRERRPYYQELATVVVDVDELTPDQVVDRVLSDPAVPPSGVGSVARP
jgi:shikimate kinase